MTALNLDKVQFTSTLPSFRNKDSGSIVVSINGTISAGGNASWTNSATFTQPERLVRYSMLQNPVPTVALYTNSDIVPLAILVGGSSFSAFLACLVTGVPAVTSIAPNIYITATTTGFTCTVTVHNPFSGTMSMTGATMTIYYTSFEAFGE